MAKRARYTRYMHCSARATLNSRRYKASRCRASWQRMKLVIREATLFLYRYQRWYRRCRMRKLS